MGGEYRPTDKLAIRLGYNYGKSPIRGGAKDIGNANRIPNFVAPFSDFYIAYFNLVGFPAITAYKHAFNKKVKATDPSGASVVEAQNAQNAVSVGLNWKF